MAARTMPFLEPGVWTGGLVPLVLLWLQFFTGGLGANPVEELLERQGLLALIALLASLSCTPLQWLTGWVWPVRIRKALGLLGFTAVTLHFVTYALLDQSGQLSLLWEDVAKRPFITVGVAAWLLLVPLAATSTAWAVRRLGFVAWKRLHRLAYLTAALGVLHFVWKEKTLTPRTGAFALVLLVLLGVRVLRRVASGPGSR